MRLLWLGICLLGCRPSTEPSEDPPDTSPPTSTVPDTADTAPPIPSTLPEALDQAGFVVQEGAFRFASYDNCCDPTVNCWGNNPSTPYGTHVVPPAPGHPHPPDLFDSWEHLEDPNLSRTFHLEAYEALVLLGNLPPKAKYLGYISNLGARPGLPYVVLGSLGPAINNMVLGERRGLRPDQIWEQPFAIITSADRAVEERVRAALIASGWEAEHIIEDRISPSVVNLGHGDRADSLYTVMRVAVFDDPDAGEAWRADPGLTVYRLTARDGVSTQPHPPPTFPPRGSARTENSLGGGMVLLEAAIQAYHHEYEGRVAVSEPYWKETIECFWQQGGCHGDIRDRYTALIQPMFLDEGEFVVIFGPNHERSGKALYASASVQSILSQRGIRSFDSSMMPGTATVYFPNHPRAEDYYAWTVARSCEGLPEPCFEVPTTCPGVPYDEPFKITLRAYLEPSSGAAPMASQLVLDRAIHFRKRVEEPR